MSFGGLLDPSWTDFGGQDGAKLAPKSVQEGVKSDVKSKQKNDRFWGLRGSRRKTLEILPGLP